MLTRFYKERSTQQKGLQFVMQDLQGSSFDLCSSNKDQIFLRERFYRPILQGLQGEKPQNSNLIMIFLCMGSYYGFGTSSCSRIGSINIRSL